MDYDLEDLEILAKDDNITKECLQIAPMGDGRCAILFFLSDPDYVTTLSLIFVVDGFDSAKVTKILETDDWIMSLSASPDGTLFALEATVWVWTYSGHEWSRKKVSDIDMQCVWAENDSGPIVVGSEGKSFRLTGTEWRELSGPAAVQLSDMHGHPKSGVYACGELGSLWRLQGNSWEAIELHRNDLFHGIDVSQEGAIRIAGDSGICLEIHDGEIIEIESPEETNFCVRTYKGRAYWGGESGLYLQVAARLEPIGETEVASDLRVDEKYLFVAGTDKAWRYDGKEWKSLRLTFDRGFKLS